LCALMAKKIIHRELCKKEKIKSNIYRQGAKYAEKNLKNSKELLLVSILFGFRSLDRIIISRRMRVGFMATGRNHQAEKQNQYADGKYFFNHGPGSRSRGVNEPFPRVPRGSWERVGKLLTRHAFFKIFCRRVICFSTFLRAVPPYEAFPSRELSMAI